MVVRVWDPTDAGFQPHGKQTLKPHSISYTAVTGIWQTVWLEAVPEQYITSVKSVPDVDKGQLSIGITTTGTSDAEYFEAKIFDGAKVIASSKALVTESCDIAVSRSQIMEP